MSTFNRIDAAIRRAHASILAAAIRAAEQRDRERSAKRESVQVGGARVWDATEKRYIYVSHDCTEHNAAVSMRYLPKLQRQIKRDRERGIIIDRSANRRARRGRITQRRNAHGKPVAKQLADSRALCRPAWLHEEDAEKRREERNAAKRARQESRS